MRYFSFKGLHSNNKNGNVEAKDTTLLPFELSNIHKKDPRHDSNISTFTLPDNNSRGSRIQKNFALSPPVHDLGRRPYVGGFSAAAYEVARFDYAMTVKISVNKE
mmetsp:Transcript_2089/g.2801  ORF Transcript_2089/g.2801 Transcript_2089/m.2801 type:complete len:105 (-) Transcript_2089:247-561(-)|eukprot:CAMPEP_0116052024 /NCGR_PEP_ID=MMETSP0322-20121206/1322_1 /TAXON_ID=163516 /ORGANISM="Leptocylindrus danicus var. apora, Strain B651" /LENGTH=104 /DNA_ID=CAMNT_0003534871 /DNA_START=108 /DNA_END=422 /DNA_ORIENTATION=-